MSTTKLAEQSFKDFVSVRNEPNWLREYRQNNFEAFRAMPENKSQYTNLKALEEMLKIPETKPEIEFNSNSNNKIIFLQFEDALNQWPEIIKNYLQREKLAIAGDKFELFTNAFFDSGYLLVVPKGLEQKVEAEVKLKIDSGSGKANINSGSSKVVCMKSIVALEQQDSAVVFEGLSSAPSAESKGVLLHNSSVFVDNSSHLEQIYFNDISEGQTCINSRRAYIGRDSRFKGIYGWFGSALTKSTVTNHLIGQGAEADHAECIYGSGKQHFDLTSDLYHEVPDTTGNIAMKAALDDNSSTIFNGMIKIFKPAQRTNSLLEAHSILLSKDASSNNIPGLEIEANDVKATHSASVHKLDEEQIFYLMARSLSREEARNLIITSFLETVIDKINVGKFRQILIDKVEGKYK